MKTNTLGWIFIFVVAAIFLIGCMPLALIWAINTLFGLAIPTTLKTWTAALLLSAPFAYQGSKK